MAVYHSPCGNENFQPFKPEYSFAGCLTEATLFQTQTGCAGEFCDTAMLGGVVDESSSESEVELNLLSRPKRHQHGSLEASKSPVPPTPSNVKGPHTIYVPVAPPPPSFTTNRYVRQA